MNIFILHKNPKIAARYHCDKHVVKMMTESVQLLSNTLHFLNLPAPYKKTHYNHPCSIWARSSLQNYQWLCKLAEALGQEFEYRYGKKHQAHLTFRAKIPYQVPLPNCGLTEFANATPYKNAKDLVKAYQKYYIYHKKHIAKWSKRRKPQWYKKRNEK